MTKMLALAFGVAMSATGATAETLTPTAAKTVDLGATQGSAYYVVGRDGYHVVATLLPAGTTNIVRFDTVLVDGQSATLSVPGPVGTPPQAMIFTRSADKLIVRRSSDARSVATQ